MASCHPEKEIIRTSDRGTFKSCRQQWDFTSKIRMNYEPKVRPWYFDFGTAVHAGLDTFYNPDTWHWPADVRTKLAKKRFADLSKKHKKQHTEAVGGALSDEEQADHDERLDLGLGMLDYYGIWSPAHDRFRPVKSEIEFEVPIVVPETYRGELAPGFGFDLRDPSHLHKQCRECKASVPVVYQGRIDLIVEMYDEPDVYWVVDHKTTARMESTEHVELDPQISSYVWACRTHLNLPVAGFLYNELYKGYPDEPKVNQTQRKGRWLSVNKQQSTTYELYMQKIQELGEPVELYEDILHHLKAAAPQFVRRTQIHRTPRELEYVGHTILDEAMDMLANPRIYPNASRWNCRGCPFRDPCLARHDGSDVQFLLEQSGMYERRA
jgi:CRISPR/Cas system-associated exonuclease Cas4 (RecB family)